MPENLGDFEQVLLLALARLGGEADGSAMRHEIERRTGREISPGALYTAMDRLESRGLADSRLGEPTPVRGGRRRKLYRLEPAGARALSEAHRQYERLVEGALPTVLEIARRGEAG
jgi:PadR family transcriptional regulator, regulatory protein PadR